MKEVALLRHQMQFIESSAQTTCMVCGRGAGKSYALAYKTVMLLAEGKSVLVCGPDYKQLKLTIFKSIIEALEQIGIKYKYNRSDYLINAIGQTVYGISGEAWEKARGLSNITALVVDEAALIPEEAIPVMSACLRGQDFPPEYYFASTPRGRTGRAKWFYDICHRQNTKTIHATSRENIIVNKKYHESMEELYGRTKFAQQELMGEFIDFKAGILDSEYLLEIEKPNEINGRLIRAYDLAVSVKSHSDYTATCLMSYFDGVYTILDIQRWKSEWPETVAKMKEIAEEDGHGVKIVIESFGTQVGLLQDARKHLRGYSVSGIRPPGDKISKALPFAASISNGKVEIVEDIEILAEYKAEMNEFDGTDNVHDDMIDASVLAYHAHTSKSKANTIKAIKGLY